VSQVNFEIKMSHGLYNHSTVTKDRQDQQKAISDIFGATREAWIILKTKDIYIYICI
jgi:hypothetical protein